MDPVQVARLVFLVIVVAFVVSALSRSVRIVPEGSCVIVERHRHYHRTLEAGLHLLIPFIDKVRARVDLREQVESLPLQPVIASDNRLAEVIDMVVYYQVIDPHEAVYKVEDHVFAMQRLAITSLRDMIGDMDWEQTLASADRIGPQLRSVLDKTARGWGIRVNRVEAGAIRPYQSQTVKG